jgi:hypothetical protein
MAYEYVWLALPRMHGTLSDEKCTDYVQCYRASRPTQKWALLGDSMLIIGVLLCNP